MRMWDRLVSGSVIEEFGHKEGEARSEQMPPDEKDLAEILFKEPPLRHAAHPVASATARTAKRTKLLQDAARIKDPKHFSYMTPESEQILVSELRLMRVLHEKDMWHRVNDAWVTGLLPKGALIHIKSLSVYTFVVKTNDASAMCWEAERISVNLWQKARRIQSLSWHTIFDLDDVEVLQTRYLSPMHLFMQDLSFLC